MAILVDVDFNEGDFTDLPTRTDPDSDLSVSSSAAMGNTSYGMVVNIDDTVACYGTITITTDTSGYLRVRYYFDFNTITMPASAQMYPIRFYNNAAQYFGYVVMRRNAGDTSYAIRVYYVLDDTTETYVASFDVTDAPHWLEIYYKRGAGDGACQCWLDDVSKGSITTLDNDTRFADFTSLRLGQTGTASASISGTYFLDELKVNNTGEYIGPYPLVVLDPAAATATAIGISISKPSVTVVLDTA